MLLTDKVAIITGGAKGIGKAIALKFAQEGCWVAIADINESEARQTISSFEKSSRPGIFINCDHTDSKQVEKMVQTVINKYGKIDILVNNAGGFGPPTPFKDLTEEEWDKRIKLNLKGAFLCCHFVIPHMVKQKYGKIINIASIAAISAGPPNAHYASAKGAVLSLGLDLAVEFAPHNIMVNTILPGTIRTDMWQTNIPPSVDEDQFFQQMARKLVPLGRIGTPDDVAGAALFLASNLSDYITGDRIIVGGGLPLQPPPF